MPLDALLKGYEFQRVAAYEDWRKVVVLLANFLRVVIGDGKILGV